MALLSALKFGVPTAIGWHASRSVVWLARREQYEAPPARFAPAVALTLLASSRVAPVVYFP